MGIILDVNLSVSAYVLMVLLKGRNKLVGDNQQGNDYKNLAENYLRKALMILNKERNLIRNIKLSGESSLYKQIIQKSFISDSLKNCVENVIHNVKRSRRLMNTSGIKNRHLEFNTLENSWYYVMKLETIYGIETNKEPKR